ncbi:MAG: hypothetical protein KAQ65_06950, partial [Candidatus Thorarchaeota archaeon]|nr:hypothetical protein [Candidatus Thorarchaeota archaeon]
MAIYERLCRISQRLPLHRIGGRTRDRDLLKAVVFLSPLMKITPEGIVSASYFTAILIFISLTSILYLLNVSLLIGVLLSLLASLIVYYVVA